MERILVFDIGNTNIKAGVFANGALSYSFRLASANKTADEYGALLLDMLQKADIKPSDINAIVLSSVNPNLNYTFVHLCDYYFAKKPLIISSGVKTGVNIKYDNPKEVGSDRIAGITGAIKEYGAPFILVDFGTATTFNVVDNKGVFLGGCIAPGLKTCADSLSESAARLPRIELNVPKTVVNKTTVGNMQSGIIFGFVGLTEYLTAKIKAETGLDGCKVIATGGLSQIVCDGGCSVIDITDRTLTLKGLKHIYDLNRQN